MGRTRSPRRWTCSLVAGLTAFGLASAPTASSEADPPRERPVVRLALDPGSVVRAAEVGLRTGTRSLATTAYSLVGVTWKGPDPRVSVRTDGSRRWRDLPPLADQGHEGGQEGGASDLLWTGRQRGIEVRVEGARSRDVELVLIDPGSLPGDGLAAATTARRAARAKPDRAPRPALLTRKDWGANNRWRNGRPSYNKRLKQVHLHHTATGNDYRRRDVPAIIRGMYRYHTKSLGWFDIGYNFLVDRFGRTWVGRSGGPNRLVRGAHTLGFNHSSVGVAVIGNYERKRPAKRVIRALTRLAAWKLDVRDRRAAGKVRVRSEGSDRYPDGKRVWLPAYDGHRDTNDTACPGDRLYGKLPTLRRRTQRRIDRFS